MIVAIAQSILLIFFLLFLFTSKSKYVVSGVILSVGIILTDLIITTLLFLVPELVLIIVLTLFTVSILFAFLGALFREEIK